MNSKRTGTLTQYNNPYNPVFLSFELNYLTPKIGPHIKLKLLKSSVWYKNFERFDNKEILEKCENNRNFVKYGKIPRHVLSIFLYPNVSKFLY